MTHMEAFLETISTLIDNVGEFANSYQNRHIPTSLADFELQTYIRSESIVTALSQGGILIEVAGDQLMGVNKTITEPALTIAPWACLRALLESSALASWLLSPFINSSTRVQRSLAFRFEGLSQQLKFVQAESELRVQIPSIKNRIDEIERLAQSLGFAEVTDKKGKRIGIGQKMPSITTLVELELSEEPLYRLLSGIAHAHPWVLQQLSFHPLTSDGFDLNSANHSVQIHWFEKHLDPELAAFLSYKAVITFMKPVWYQCQLFGWNKEQLGNIFDRAYNKMGINLMDRFWRNNCDNKG